MPSYPCAHPRCPEYVARQGDGCPEHATHARDKRAERHRRYDRLRDPRAKQFYNTAKWKRARESKLATDPICEECGEFFAEQVHHHRPLLEAWELRLDPRNLRSLCAACHNAQENR